MEKPKTPTETYPVYVYHWRESETRMRLSLEARGLYWELLFYAAIEGSLPISPRNLAQISGCTERKFKILWPELEKCFVERDGRLHNAKVDKVLQEQALYFQKQAESGRIGAEKRWGRHSDPIGNPNATPMAGANARARDSYSSYSENTEQSSRATRARGATSTNGDHPSPEMERICREAAERHPNRNRSASPYQICQALLSNGHSDADSLAKFESWSVEYAEETDPKFSTKILELIARQAYMIQPKHEESIYPDFTPRPNGGG